VMSSFMDQYVEKVLVKYLEVNSFLIGGTRLVTGSPLSWPVDHDTALKCTTFIFKYIAKWKDAHDWMYKFFLGGIPEFQDNENLLPELRQYFRLNIFKNMSRAAWALVPDIAKDKIDGAIQPCLRHCSGNDASENFFTITTFRDWIEVQSMLGIMHGSTLNISRLSFTPYFYPDGQWERKDIGNVSAVLKVVAGTMCGLQHEFAFANGSPLKDTEFHSMMKQFDNEVAKVQKEFWDDLSKDKKQIYGWWYSVWGPNMVGKTQLTATTYV